MSIEGDPELWAVLFPEYLIPDILDLTLGAWVAFAKPAPDEEEEEITRKFKVTLIRSRDQVRLPVSVVREYYEDDPETGEHLGRIDIRFTARSVLETNYFAFECKRLNALVNNKTRPLASEYVTKGMIRFIEGQYAQTQHHGGMIGYVLDGDSDHAMKLVKKNVAAKRKPLRMQDPGVLETSALRPRVPVAMESKHHLDRGLFFLHHLFLTV